MTTDEHRTEEAVHQRRVESGRGRQDDAGRQSRHRGSHRGGRIRRSRGRGCRRRRGQGRLAGPWGQMSARDRGRLIWKLADRADRARRRDRASRDAAQREAAQRVAADRDPSRRRVPPVLRRLGGQGPWRNRTCKGNHLVYTLREPVGVVAAIVPWNFPLLLASWKVAPALACGNTVILKPASQTPLTALALAEIAAEVGLPPGVLNVITGPGVLGRTGHRRTSRDRQDCLHGRHRDRQADHAELGGNAEADHAGARREVAEHRAAGRRHRGGGPRGDDRHLLRQGRGLRRRLAAAGRPLDQGRVHGEAGRARRRRWCRAIRMDPKTRLGAIASKGQLERVLRYVDTAQKARARHSWPAGAGPTSARAAATSCSPRSSTTSRRR